MSEAVEVADALALDSSLVVVGLFAVLVSNALNSVSVAVLIWALLMMEGQKVDSTVTTLLEALVSKGSMPLAATLPVY